MLAGGFSLEFEWQQVSSSLQDSSQYSGRPQKYCRLGSLHPSANFQVLQALFIYLFICLFISLPIFIERNIFKKWFLRKRNIFILFYFFFSWNKYFGYSLLLRFFLFLSINLFVADSCWSSSTCNDEVIVICAKYGTSEPSSSSIWTYFIQIFLWKALIHFFSSSLTRKSH